MLERNFLLLQLPSTAGAGLIAGTFFCFSSFVMPALARLEPAQGITAMQKINVTVINPLFMAVLFGTAICYAIESYVVFRAGVDKAALFWLLAAVLYIAGTIGVTIICNVPLNDQLADIAPNDVQATTLWLHYLKDWTFWNNLRGIAATAACIASICALTIRD